MAEGGFAFLGGNDNGRVEEAVGVVPVPPTMAQVSTPEKYRHAPRQKHREARQGEQGEAKQNLNEQVTIINNDNFLCTPSE